jgi:hypothetical protein
VRISHSAKFSDPHASSNHLEISQPTTGNGNDCNTLKRLRYSLQTAGQSGELLSVLPCSRLTITVRQLVAVAFEILVYGRRW